MTPVPIFIPMSLSEGSNVSLIQAGISITVTLLFVQYIALGVFILTNDYFTSKLHALAWFLPGWPVLEFAWQFIRNFMELD